MTSIAQEKPATATAVPVERAVFVTDDDRRSRIARRLALAVLGVATLWVAALAVGMLGLGQLPGVSLPLPGVVGKVKQHEQHPGSQPLVRSASIKTAVPATRPRRSEVVRASAAAPAAARRSRAKARPAATRTATAPTRRRTAAPVAATTPSPVQAAAAPRVARGLERRGLTSPPGQTQKATAAATTTAQGQTKTPKGEVKRADATQPPPPPAPGQQKPDKPPAKA